MLSVLRCLSNQNHSLCFPFNWGRGGVNFLAAALLQPNSKHTELNLALQMGLNRCRFISFKLKPKSNENIQKHELCFFLDRCASLGTLGKVRETLCELC